MAFEEEKQGAKAPAGGDSPAATEPENSDASGNPFPEAESAPGPATDETPATDGAAVSDDTSAADQTYDRYDDPYAESSSAETEVKTEAPPAAGGTPPPPSPPDEEEEEDGGENRMLRMSFLEHLEELRSRLLYCLMGVGAAFLVSLVFAERLWVIVSDPATDALLQLGSKDPRLAQITPMEVFTTVYVKLPILAAIFLSSPWILYQVWAFISPGLYKRERRWAAPFVICSAGLFILGGLFAYHVAFRFGLVFLLGIGRDIKILPVVSVTEYFHLFVNVTLGVGVVFELPVLIFFLTLLRVVSPSFLLKNTRYAVLLIVVLAALITPTPDVFNLTMFAVPMILLFFVGVFASYLLVLQRENRRFPWKKVFYVALVVLSIVAGVIYLAVTKYGYQLVGHWPFLTR